MYPGHWTSGKPSRQLSRDCSLVISIQLYRCCFIEELLWLGNTYCVWIDCMWALLEFVVLEHGHASSRKLIIFNQSSEVLISFQVVSVILFSLLYWNVHNPTELHFTYCTDRSSCSIWIPETTVNNKWAIKHCDQQSWWANGKDLAS